MNMMVNPSLFYTSNKGKEISPHTETKAQIDSSDDDRKMNYVIDICCDEVEIHLGLYAEERSDEHDTRELEQVDERESSNTLIMSEHPLALDNQRTSADDVAETMPLDYIVFDRVREKKKVINALMDDTDDSEDESDHSLDGEETEVVEVLKRTKVAEEGTTMNSNKEDCLQSVDSRVPNKLLKALFAMIILAVIFVFK